MTTRSRGKEIFQHILTNVLNLKETDQLCVALSDSGYDTVTDLATLTEDEIDKFTFVESGTSRPVLKKQRKLLSHLLLWRDWRSKQLTTFTHENWMELDSASFTQFRDNQLPDIVRGGSHAPSTSSSGDITHGIVTSSEVISFKKSIDKSNTDFPEFNGHISKWMLTKQTYIAVAANHGISRILDESAVPPEGSRDRELFDVQNRYFYNILKVKVKSGRARAIVNQHAISLDGKSAWGKCVAFYEQKSISSMAKATYFERLSNMRLTTNYRGGPSRFLTDFENIVTELAQLTGEDMKDDDLVGFLSTAISSYEPFKSIKASIDSAALMSSTEITFDGMLHVLYNNCSSSKSVQQTRQVTAAQGKQTPPNNNQSNNDWKKDYTKWVPIKEFKSLPESEQKARKEAQLKAKKQKRKVNAVTKDPSSANMPSGNIFEVSSEMAPTFREIMAASKVETKQSADGDTWIRLVKPCRVVRISNMNAVTNQFGGLIDSGANTSLQGSDMRMMHQEHGSVAIVGPSDGVEHGMSDLSLVTCGGVATTSLGEEVLVVVTSAASFGKGKSIISKFQLEEYGCTVNDKARVLGGRQSIRTPEGDVFKLRLQSGLLYLPLRFPTDHELEHLRHVLLTSNGEQWNPDVFNDRVEDEEWFDCVEACSDGGLDDDEFFDSRDGVILESNFTERTISGAVGKRTPIDFNQLRPYFLWKPIEAIRKTFAVTTQFMETVWYNTPRLPLRRHFKSRAPFMNVRRLNEGYATDTIFANSKAHDGSSCAQIYVGCSSQFVYLEGMSQKSQMPRTLMNFIRGWGAMRFLWRDMAKEENSKAVNDLLRAIHASNRFSEPFNQHQNPAERKILDVKSGTRTVMDRTGTPSKWWLLCMSYVVYVMNHIALASLDWQTPYFRAFGITRDISPLLLYQWWEPVYYYDPDMPFPDSRERLGHFAGFADDVGDSFCFKIVSTDTEQVIYRSVLRSALDDNNPNLRAQSISRSTNGESSTDSGLPPETQYTQPLPGALLRDASDTGIHLMSNDDQDQINPEIPTTQAHYFDPDELIGKTFLREREVDGTIHRAEIVQRIENSEAITDQYLVKFGNGEREEVMSYNAIVDFLSKQIEKEIDDPNSLYSYKSISNHRKVNNQYEVLVEWECGESTWEPVAIIRRDDPVTLAQYGKEHGLLDEPGWKRLKHLVKSVKRLTRNIKQARMFAARTVQRYKFGVKVPRNESEARALDQENGNLLWNDAIDKELTQVIEEYNTFKDLGKYKGRNQIPKDFQLIKVNMVFDVKHDLRHKCRLVAGGHLTKPNGDTSYSSVASLRSIRLVTFIAELNNLDLEAADVGNAYLEATTNEKVCFVAGPSFAKFGLEGHLLIIHKALYGLRNSGACYHSKWADAMVKLGFSPSRSDPDVWMKDKGDHYEYVVVYVDDLLYAGKNAKQYWKDVLAMGYKLKGVGTPTYHLGATFERVKDPEPMMTWGPVRYVQKILDQYEKIFGEQVKNSRKIHAPLEPGDHPELDTSDLCNEDEKAKYMSMVGSLQWALSLGRIDIGAAVMTMSRFRVSPRKGHLDRLKRIYSYLHHFKNSSIKFNVEIPDYTHFDNQWSKPDWVKFYGDGAGVYDDPKLPDAKGNPIVMTTYVDANLLHDYVTGRSCTGVIHLFNKTVIDWFSKLQSNVETATYGSEFTALRTAVDQIHDLRYTARGLGIPIIGSTYLFGDNLSTIISSTKSDGKIAKRWNILSFHRVREAVAHGIVRPFHIDGKDNPADVLSKHTSSRTWYELMRPLIFWRVSDRHLSRSRGEGSINM